MKGRDKDVLFIRICVFYVSEREKEWLGVQVIWVRERGDKYHG